MALNASTLSAAIKAELAADPNIVDNDSLATLCDAIAEAVVSHLQSAAVVNPNPNPPVATGLLSPAGAVTGTGSLL